ncbi:hypothetical protein PMI42_03477 [Bradyrhizobium sp. YR681]|uniref:hypothetical protein n=1 Tax=Bradyrhizobium sp. YR681 TaxID=1144344 RepID=UPI000270EEDB|nr:hypothetical protein [Bradyrhizobium sp. YR681]EJN13185.1 hypothetical protein PMI42_03477 [Bradyrhizobium sp. YR681]
MVKRHAFSIGILAVTLLAGPTSAEVYFSDATVEISGSGPRTSRNCTVVLKPVKTRDGDLAPQLSLVTSGQSRLSLDLAMAGQYSAPVVVQNNIRRPFARADNVSTEQFRLSDIGRTLASRRLFFVTAQRLDNAKYASGRYERLDFDALLARIEAHCPFDAESLMADIAARQRAEQSLSISAPDLVFMRWTLNKKYGESSARPDPAYALSPQERSYLKRYAADNGLAISQYLTAETARLLRAEGQQIANAVVPVPAPTPAAATPWPPLPPGPKQNFWSHNGSRVQLKSDPEKPGRIFVYEAPSEDLRRSGVSSGTILFRGGRTGNRYAGTAYAFAAGCTAASYEVAGNVSEDQRQVVLQGLAPVQASGCRITGRRVETLTFVFHDAQDNWGEAR